ncbi:MAG: glutamate--tRNA ligase [Alicyclobacillus sp.]|nr:glutamate--tRNA ligase [Alicyclobacillus sp.]
MKVRVRFAPSPTGRLHLGGARTALFNYLFARRYGGHMVLRIEDTDLERNVPGAEQEIMEALHWLGLAWQEGPDTGGAFGPYRCTERQELYRHALQSLQERGLVYPCFCTPEELAAERAQALAKGQVPRYSGRCRHLTDAQRAARQEGGEPYLWRFAVPADEVLTWDDAVRGPMSFRAEDLGDFVLVKSNGMPTYNFQVVVDDAAMHITHVIRGEEHLSNTPRQLLLFQALATPAPVFAHLPQVLNSERKKLSKRDPQVEPVLAYREKGYAPEALVNFLALLGWSPGGEQELFSLDELCSRFDLARVHRSGAVFDVDKLHWMAGVYLRQQPLPVLLEQVSAQLAAHGLQPPPGSGPDWLERAVALYREEMTCAADFIELAGPVLLQPDVEWQAEALAVLQQPEAATVVQTYRALAAEDPDWTAEASRRRFRAVQQTLGVKGKALYLPVRAAVTGRAHGPDLQETIACLPRSWVLARLDQALAEVRAGLPGEN